MSLSHWLMSGRKPLKGGRRRIKKRVKGKAENGEEVNLEIVEEVIR